MHNYLVNKLRNHLEVCCESGGPTVCWQLPDTELTGEVLFLLVHLPLQVRQQCLAPVFHGEDDGVDVIAGGFQSQGVEGHQASHRPAVRERAEENQGEFMMELLKLTTHNHRVCYSTFGGRHVNLFSDCLGSHSPWPGCGCWTAVKPSGHWD